MAKLLYRRRRRRRRFWLFFMFSAVGFAFLFLATHEINQVCVYPVVSECGCDRKENLMGDMKQIGLQVYQVFFRPEYHLQTDER